MSRHFVIDGYNALHSTEKWANLSREAQRLQFLKFLDDHRPTGSPKNSVTVVFDGYAASLLTIRLSHVRLLFSGDRDADTVIKEWVEERANPREVVVVTDDRGLRSAVRASGAQVMSCADFFLLGKKRAAPKRIDKPDSETADSINKELKRLWKLD